MATQSWPSTRTILRRYSSDVGYGRANLPGALHIGAGAPYLWVQNNDRAENRTKSFLTTSTATDTRCA
jgi:hypothetical protein